MGNQISLWTIGHSTLSIEDFISRLESFEIQVLADVRSYPGSRRYPHFNADEMTKSSTPAIQRLLGSAGELGSRLGLDNKWMLQAIKAGGNYGEIFERNVGKASPLKLDRGLNATWSKGGLMYAIPFK